MVLLDLRATEAAFTDARGRAHFGDKLSASGLGALGRGRVTTVQVNVGKRCNQACLHCHVEAGPNRTEVMSSDTVDRILVLLRDSPEVATLDITGGAPELNPDFRRLVTAARAAGRRVIVRHNLTVQQEPSMAGLPDFFREHRVEVVASLPCYSASNVNSQRGSGVFDRSIAALQALNARGYGDPATGLLLNLVYNPGGAFLPPAQDALEAEYRVRLFDDFGVRFSQLFTITNMPIKRFAHQLRRDGALDGYMALLSDSFNATTVAGLMCRSEISVSWDGGLYDCDFNQMLAVPLSGATPRTIWDISCFEELADTAIGTGAHCLGCTAGAGSSCGGALT